MPSASGAGSVESADIAPQTSPSTMIGAPAHERIPLSRAAPAIVPGTAVKSSIRAGRPVSRTCAVMVGPSSGQRVPTWNGWGASLHSPITVAVRSCSKRQSATIGSPTTSPTSRTMAANTSVGAAPPATSAATRRRAACSPVRTSSCSRSRRSARMRTSMSVKATTAPRPSCISSGAEK